MRGTRLAGDFGEYYTALCLLNSGGWREPDILDSNGIDLAAYPTDENKPALGISVKTRNVANTENSSILLRKKDITYCFKEAMARNLEPCFSFVIIGNGSLDILVLTLDSLIEERQVVDAFDVRMGEFARETLSIPISKNARERWGKYDNIFHLLLKQ